MDKKVVELYKDYKHGLTDRRSFIKKLAMITGSTTAAKCINSCS